MIPEYPSTALERAVNAFSSLPGIGRRTALRLVLHLLSRPESEVVSFGKVLETLKSEIRYCRVCHNISDTDVCPICANPKRDASQICVVENVQDVLAIENTMQYKGVYHVLHGVLSPMDGVTPEQLRIKELLARIDDSVAEVIMATNPTVEGEATAMYIARLLKPAGIKVTRIAHGIPVGGDLEYADEVTLAKAMEGRREL